MHGFTNVKFIKGSYISYSMNICRDRKAIVCLVMFRPYTTSYQSLVYKTSNEHTQSVPKQICLCCPLFDYGRK